MIAICAPIRRPDRALRDLAGRAGGVDTVARPCRPGRTGSYAAVMRDGAASV